ncbi:MAG: hypothetical protein ABIO19_09820, partial [Burkholderiaceae bacterium]
MAATPYASGAAHWQQNRIGPLGAIVLLHAGLFFALRSGMPLAAVPTGPKTLFANFITPERPTVASAPAPQVAPPKPRKAHKTPTPRKTESALTPMPVAAPAPHAISALALPAQPAAAPDAPSMAQASAPAAAPAPPTQAAPTQAAPAQPKTISTGVEYL